MSNTQDQVRQELKVLVEEGERLLGKLFDKQAAFEFGATYQAWYTRTLPLVRTLAPDRFSEFKGYYEVDSKRKAIGEFTYVLQDYVSSIAPLPDSVGNTAFDHRAVATSKMWNQIQILSSMVSRIGSVLANVEGRLLAEIEDRELKAAVQLAKFNLRAAGTLVGVVLERHLGQVAFNREVKIGKNSTIGDLNEALKKHEAYDLPTYRRIQYLADIRNICCHSKGREPTADEVSELLAGSVAVVKTVF